MCSTLNIFRECALYVRFLVPAGVCSTLNIFSGALYLWFLVPAGGCSTLNMFRECALYLWF